MREIKQHYLLADVVEKVEPLQQKISSVAELIPSDVVQTEPPSKVILMRTSNYEDQLLPDMQLKPGTELKFTKIPSRSFPEGSSAMDITKYSIDTSYILEQMLSRWERYTQFSFKNVTFSSQINNSIKTV